MDSEALWKGLRPDRAGLVTAVVQHQEDGRILMVGHMNAQALAATLSSRRVTFWSRSRDCLWEKGESSGNTLDLKTLRVDCDGDALLVQATPRGPTCHTGRSSCFYMRVEGSDAAQLPADDGPEAIAAAVVDRLFETIERRKGGEGATQAEGKSYVRALLDKGIEKINAKIEEESDELCVALRDETDERVASEMADLLFHALVGLSARSLSPQEVYAVLRARLGVSGLDEKASRPRSEAETPKSSR